MAALLHPVSGLMTQLPRARGAPARQLLASLERPWGLILFVVVPFYVAIDAVSISSFVLSVIPNKEVLLLPLWVRIGQQLLLLALACGCYRLALAAGWPQGLRARARAALVHVGVALLVGIAARPILIAVAQLSLPEPQFGWRSFTNFSGYGARLWIASTLDSMMTYFFGLALLFGVRATLALRATELARAELEHAWTTARLQALRMQLNPHFLFNAFNTIITLLDSQPARARALVLNISDLFRRTLAVSETEWTRLADEFDYLRDYLSVQAARYPHRFAFAVQAAPGTEGARIPALLLQPLVENATVHGVIDDRHSLSVWAAARLVNGASACVEIEVGNRSTGPLPTPRATLGVGLTNTRARLSACYGERAALSFGQTDGSTYLVTLRVPFESLAS